MLEFEFFFAFPTLPQMTKVKYSLAQSFHSLTTVKTDTQGIEGTLSDGCVRLWLPPRHEDQSSVGDVVRQALKLIARTFSKDRDALTARNRLALF